MQPQKRAGQRLISFDLELDPAAQLFSYADTFGNAVYHFDIPQPHERLTDHGALGHRDRARRPDLPDGLDRGEWDRLKTDFVRGEHFDFLHPHGSPSPTAALRRLRRREASLEELRGSRSAQRGCATSARSVYEAFAYEAGVARANSPIDDVLKAAQRRLPGLRPCDAGHLPRAGASRRATSPATCSPTARPATAPTPTPPTPGSRPSCREPALGGLRSDQQHRWPPSATWPARSGATTPTCRPRAGSTRARPKAS